MHVGRNRIFVGNLPPAVNETDIKKQFQPFGNVVSIEIKQRKENINENVSPVFAFVSIETDKNQLHECFQTIANYKWDGYYVKLELAKESFLERLKREREEAQNKTVTQEAPIQTDPIVKSLITSTSAKKIYSSSDSSDSDSDSSSSDSEIESDKKTRQNGVKPSNTVVDDELKDLVIKNNKNKNLTNGKLTIESVNSTPIHVITLKSNSLHKSGEKITPADEKRLNSLYKLKESYDQQKSLIANALSHIDTKQSNKIVFDDEGRQTNKRKHNFNDKHAKKVHLFDQDEQQDDDINFDIRQQFEGKQGQRLLELQSRFTNDKRFTLDSRFVENDETEQNDEFVDDDEKKKQFEILESVIGKKFNVRPEQHQSKNIPRGMLRYDPTNREHSKFEITKQINDEPLEEVEEKVNEPIEVSKEKFYKVTDNLQQTFKENQGGFSLLSMYGRNEEQKVPEPEENATKLTKLNFDNHNPFRYDSSDSEVEDIKEKKVEIKKANRNFRNISGEKFFFHTGDERLKDGLSFLKKFGAYNNESTQKFMETRREIKQIIRSKLRNVQRNNRPFRKKIGQHKHIKMKKAKKN